MLMAPVFVSVPMSMAVASFELIATPVDANKSIVVVAARFTVFAAVNAMSSAVFTALFWAY